ncbi:MAG: GntR family transcriptional regulator [Spirochaetales bacterium]|nr:GntR family transcriptional regulator [Spirochaetales bacterium]
MHRARKSLYQMAYEDLKEKIMVLPDGAKLSSHEKLCKELNVSKAVIREVLAGLEREGLIVRRQGIGTFVVRNSDHVHTGLEYLRGIPNIISSSGKKSSLLINKFEKVKIDHRVSEKLRLVSGVEVVRVNRLYAVDNIPAIYAVTYISPKQILGGTEALLDVFNNEKLSHDTIFSLLENEFNRLVKYALCEITSMISDEKHSKLLNINRNKSLTLLLEVHYDEENYPILYSEDCINTEIFKIHVLRKKI